MVSQRGAIHTIAGLREVLVDGMLRPRQSL